MRTGLEVRVPFCDYRLVQYLWNVPWEMKNRNGLKKALLQEAFRPLLPAAIIDWRKSSYPFNQHPAYVAFVMDEMRDVLHEPNAPIRDFLAKDRVLAMLDNRARYERHLWV
jgi:asparagine synthase (glutamine-hydrolysing)